jgi:tetratricopeptide (TPR) repeat protein
VWRPIIDMTHAEAAPIALRMIRPVSEWIGAGEPGRVSWFSRMSVPGLRRQVLRHAGLDAYDAAAPADLPAPLRTPAWQRLAAAVDGFAGLDPYTRALVVFQLAQLTLAQHAVALTGIVPPTGQEGADHYAYEVARVHARVPGLVGAALPVFEALATGPDPLLAHHACFQGIAHALRAGADLARAGRFEAIAAGRPALTGGWEAHMTLSRYHRALVRLRTAQGRADSVRDELRNAWREQDLMDGAGPGGDADFRMLSDENRRDLLDLEIESARTVTPAPPERLREWAEQLMRLDPRAVEARLFAGDAYALAGDHATAAHWYARAGELGTSAGAMGWYRAGQCYDLIGDVDAAVNAMGRCLELDTTAVEPQRYLAERG